MAFENFYLCFIFFRVVMPVLITSAICIRPSIISGLYLILLLLSATVPIPTYHNMHGGWTGVYLKIVILVTILMLMGQAAFQLMLYAFVPYGDFLKNCEPLETIIRHIGYVRFDGISVYTSLLWAAPEFIMLVTSVASYYLLLKWVGKKDNLESGVNDPSTENIEASMGFKKPVFIRFVLAGRYMVLLLIAYAAVLQPSLIGLFYFLIYNGCGIWWACFKNLGKAFAHTLQVCIVVVVFHLMLIGGYQLPIIHNTIPEDNQIIRYLAIYRLYNMSCIEPRRIVYRDNLEISSILMFVTLVVVYFFLVMESKNLIKVQKLLHEDDFDENALRVLSIVKLSESIIKGKYMSSIEIDESEDTVEVEEPGYFENIKYAFQQVFQFTVKYSYIITNIIMMAWSIAYPGMHSFIFLVWVIIIWMIPNQRKSTLRCSPFLVCYTTLVVLLSYLYSIDLSQKELVNMGYFYFVEANRKTASVDLLIKCLFSAMFWFTMRQFMQEKVNQESTELSETQEVKGIFFKIEKIIIKISAKFWIWIVALTLFGIGVSGGVKLTLLTIFYMVLFLYFILAYQFSYHLWRKTMYSFFVVVIFYSVLHLFLVYSYQFFKFRLIFDRYIPFKDKVLSDIGFEQYRTRQLFQELATPTICVIIAVIQLHHFHFNFLLFSLLNTDRSLSKKRKSIQNSLVTTDILGFTDDVNSEPTKCRKFLKKISSKYNIFLTILEIHMPKLILLIAMIVCTQETNHMLLLLLISIILGTVSEKMLTFSLCTSSLIISFAVLLKMVTQIIGTEYYMPFKYTICNYTTAWGQINVSKPKYLFDFEKQENVHIVYLIKWNIVYIFVITFWKILKVRQINHRASEMYPANDDPYTIQLVFPDVTISNAHNNLKHYLMYLCNHGYYRCGVEVSLIFTAILIAGRKDGISIIYSIWLCILFPLSRKKLKKIWNFYLTFIAILILLQYAVICSNRFLKTCQAGNWLYYLLLYEKSIQKFKINAFIRNTRKPTMLIYDFLLLQTVARQALNFYIEKRNGDSYIGGSNEPIINLFEKVNFVNPMPDFTNNCRTYLDVAKVILVKPFLSITLIIVYITATNRITVYSLGYLLAAFYYCWHGIDIHLLPIPKILQMWSYMLGYNVFVLFLKSILHYAACFNMHFIEHHACWSINLFGLRCILDEDRKTAGGHYCNKQAAYLSLNWDAVCFVCLIFQRRLFHSYSFLRVIDDTKANLVLFQRGADLMNDLHKRKMFRTDEAERIVLERIRVKISKIKQNQDMMRAPFLEDLNISHHMAIRSGDYYMFSDLDDAEVMEDKSEERVSDEPKLQRKQTLGELINTTIRNFENAQQENTYLSPKTTSPLSNDETPTSDDDLKRPPVSDERIGEDKTKKKRNICRSIWKGIVFCGLVIESLMLSITIIIDKYTMDHRYVLRILNRDKKILKESSTYKVGLRKKEKGRWTPDPVFVKHMTKQYKDKGMPYEEYSISSSMLADQHIFIRHCLSIWYLLLASSDIICYCVIFLKQVIDHNWVMLPVPILVLCWGTLSKPRPTKSFWISIITYSKFALMMRCIFQLNLMQWKNLVSKNEDNILGLHNLQTFVTWDLVLFIVLFFNRFMLKYLGLWTNNTTNTPDILLEGTYYINEEGMLVSSEDSSDKDQLYRTKYKLDTDALVISSQTILHLKPRRGLYYFRRKRKTRADGTTYIKSILTKATGGIKVRTRTIEIDRREVHSSPNLSIISETIKDPQEVYFDVKTTKIAMNQMFPVGIKISFNKYAEHIQKFFYDLFDPMTRIATDIYSYMFLCDFINFFIVLFKYNSFQYRLDNQNVFTFIQDNNVPTLYMLILLIHFLMIIADRAIFLRKNIVAKIVYQFIQIFLLHIWIFVYIPINSDPILNNNTTSPHVYYLIKCIYLLLSAYQIRCGYPTRILGNFICKSYTYANLILFKIFMIIPFLFELRTIMDWIWTDTSMTIFDWMKTEDIFAHIFQLKCIRTRERNYPQKRGVRKIPIIKYFMGGGLLAIIVGVIWFPLVFFSLGTAVGESNVPTDVTIEFVIGGFSPIFRSSVKSAQIKTFTEADLKSMNTIYSNHRVPFAFLSNYKETDIVAIELSSDSDTIWDISPPQRKSLVDYIASDQPMEIRLICKIIHKSLDDNGPKEIRNEFKVVLESNGKDNKNRKKLLKMVETENPTVDPIRLINVIPKFIKVDNKGSVEPIYYFMEHYPIIDRTSFSNVTINLKYSGLNGIEWWEMKEVCEGYKPDIILRRLPYFSCDFILIYIFSDKIYPSSLNSIAKGGIIGLYFIYFWAAFNIFRTGFTKKIQYMWYTELPNVDYIYGLIWDIYLARSVKLYDVEEYNYSRLVYLMRQPDMLIIVSRHPHIAAAIKRMNTEAAADDRSLLDVD